MPDALPATAAKPFVIEVRQNRPKPGGPFVPAASLKLQEELRTSGLLHSLAPEDLKNLLFLLTFIAPEGHCSVSLSILASAMKVSSLKVKARMHRLAGVKWQGGPLIVEVPHESGLFTYSLHPRLVAYEHLTVSDQHPTPPLAAADASSAAKDRIISYSRDHYARPRQEVERIVAAQLGYDSEESDEQRKLRYRLENAGLTGEQAREVVSTYDGDVIAQQLDWLRFRNAKNPAGYLLAAIEGSYSEPRAVREERVLCEEQLLREERILREERLLQELHYDAIQSEERPLVQSEEELETSEGLERLEDRNEPDSVPQHYPQAEVQQGGATHNKTAFGASSGDASSGDASSGAEIAALAADGETITLTPEA